MCFKSELKESASINMDGSIVQKFINEDDAANYIQYKTYHLKNIIRIFNLQMTTMSSYHIL